MKYGEISVYHGQMKRPDGARDCHVCDRRGYMIVMIAPKPSWPSGWRSLACDTCDGTGWLFPR
jgi:hypothetical protein